MVQVDRSRLPEPGDRNIDCVECSVTFVFTAGEQQYFQEKDLTMPKRCSACRRARREGRQQAQREEPT